MWSSEAWLLGIGISILYSTMVSKVWRILKIVEGSERGEAVVDAGLREQLGRVLKFVALNALLLVTMSAVAPLEYVVVNQPLSIDEDNRGVAYQASGVCSVNQTPERWRRWVSGLAFLSMVAAQFANLVYGNVLCYRARGIPRARLEHSSIASSMAVLGGFASMAALLNLATRGVQPLAQACTKWATIIVIVYTTLGLIFGPKVCDVHFPQMGQEAENRAASIRQLEDHAAMLRESKPSRPAVDATRPSALGRETSSSAAGSGADLSRHSVWRVLKTKLAAARAMKLSAEAEGVAPSSLPPVTSVDVVVHTGTGTQNAQR